jgi:hypothetical protein
MMGGSFVVLRNSFVHVTLDLIVKANSSSHKYLDVSRCALLQEVRTVLTPL